MLKCKRKDRHGREATAVTAATDRPLNRQIKNYDQLSSKMLIYSVTPSPNPVIYILKLVL